MTKQILFLVAMICLMACTNKNTIAEIGEMVPNYKFKKILNSNEKDISLSELKGKPVILEFWATWCGPCIPAMKKLDSIKKEFGNDIEIIAISTENTDRLKKFIETTNTSLSLVSDTIHTKIFKYKIIPHAIVIDKKGIVRAITDPQNLNRNIIKEFIENDILDLASKNDFSVDPTLKTEVIKSITNSDYRIELTEYDQKKSGGYRMLKDQEGKINGIDIRNSTIPRLYQTLYEVSTPNRIIFKDSLSYDDFPYEKEFQYNLTIEVSEKYQNNWREIGINFLNEYFDVNAKMGIDTLDCYVLKDIDNTIQESSSAYTESMFKGTIFNSKKVKISRLVDYLENFTPLPVSDQTNLSGEYDINLNWQAEDPKTIHSELKKYGLKLEKSDKKLPVETMQVFIRNK